MQENNFTCNQYLEKQAKENLYLISENDHNHENQIEQNFGKIKPNIYQDDNNQKNKQQFNSQNFYNQFKMNYKNSKFQKIIKNKSEQLSTINSVKVQYEQNIFSKYSKNTIMNFKVIQNKEKNNINIKEYMINLQQSKTNKNQQQQIDFSILGHAKFRQKYHKIFEQKNTLQKNDSQIVQKNEDLQSTFQILFNNYNFIDGYTRNITNKKNVAKIRKTNSMSQVKIFNFNQDYTFQQKQNLNLPNNQIKDDLPANINLNYSKNVNDKKYFQKSIYKLTFLDQIENNINSSLKKQQLNQFNYQKNSQ